VSSQFNEEKDVTQSQDDEISIDEYVVIKKNPLVTIREEMEEDGKYVLFNAENEFILVINSTGKFILENCDGKRNLKEIADLIEKEFTIKKKEEIDLIGIVKEFAKFLLKGKLVLIIKEE